MPDRVDALDAAGALIEPIERRRPSPGVVPPRGAWHLLDPPRRRGRSSPRRIRGRRGRSGAGIRRAVGARPSRCVLAPRRVQAVGSSRDDHRSLRAGHDHRGVCSPASLNPSARSAAVAPDRRRLPDVLPDGARRGARHRRQSGGQRRVPHGDRRSARRWWPPTFPPKQPA